MEAEEQKGRFQLLKSSAIVSGMTMISRLFGLARDMVIAYFFGAAAGAGALSAVPLRAPRSAVSAAVGGAGSFNLRD